MKKIIFVILLMAITATLFYACKKDTVENNNVTSFEMSENGEIIYNKLVAFKHKMKDTQKEGALMSIDSAQWYTEAYYNVTSGYPDSAYHKFDVDSATYTINVDENNMVSVADLSTLIIDMEIYLNSIITQYGQETAHMVVGDVNIIQTSRSTFAEVYVITGLGRGDGNLYIPFPLEECWFYGMTAGRCDLTPPTPPYADAGDELEWRFNNPDPLYTPYPNCASGSIKIISTNNSFYIKGYNHPLIYSEWYPGVEEYPGYIGSYWNVFLNYGYTLFYENEQSGGLVPNGNNFFTSVDITTFSEEQEDENGIDGYRYFHAYDTFYSQYECIPIIE